MLPLKNSVAKHTVQSRPLVGRGIVPASQQNSHKKSSPKAALKRKTLSDHASYNLKVDTLSLSARACSCKTFARLSLE